MWGGGLKIHSPNGLLEVGSKMCDLQMISAFMHRDDPPYPLWKYGLASTIKYFQSLQVKLVKIHLNWIKTYDQIEFLAFRTCILIGHTFLWPFWFLRYGYWTDFHKIAKMREK